MALVILFAVGCYVRLQKH